MSNHKHKMTALCHSFPSLRGLPGTAPWDQLKFANSASSLEWSSGQQQAARFVLSVWNGGTPSDGGWWNEEPYRVGRFDAVDAVGTWDSEHIAAFLAWCSNPFWP